MLILIEWQEGGGLFRYTDGRIVFKAHSELKEQYIPFVHHSPEGEVKDKIVYVWKVYFQQ